MWREKEDRRTRAQLLDRLFLTTPDCWMSSNGDEALQEGHDDTDPLLDLLLLPPTQHFAPGIPIFCIFLKVSETAGKGDVLNSTTNSSPSPPENHSDLRYQIYFLLLFVGVDRACLSAYTLQKAANSICILLVWVFLTQQAKTILSNSDFNSIKFIWNKHQKWRNWKADVALEHHVALNTSVLLVMCCWQDKGRKTPTFPLATCFLVLEAREEGEMAIQPWPLSSCLLGSTKWPLPGWTILLQIMKPPQSLLKNVLNYF